MVTFLALAALLQPGTIGAVPYSSELAAKYWIFGAPHGVWDGRPTGPFSLPETRGIVSARRHVRENSAVVTADDLAQLSRALSASDAALGEMLFSNDGLLVRNAVAEAFLRRRQSLAPPLAKLVQGGAHRFDAIPALAAIGGTEAITTLKGLLKDRDRLDAVSAAYGLAANGRKDGIDLLWYAVRHPLVKSLSATRTQQVRASNALIRLGDVDTRAELDEVFQRTRANGRYLCPLLAESGKSAQLKKLRDLVVDATADHLVRKWAVTALGDIRDRAAVPNLKRALADPSRQVREAATAALQRIGT